MQKTSTPVIGEYFENGIKITVLEGFTEIVPKNSKLKNRKLIKRSKRYADEFYNRMLREWCAKGIKRVQALAAHSTYSEFWFEKRKQGQVLVSYQEYTATISIAMQSVENTEQLNKITAKYVGSNT